jgi:hypothetical protein
MHMRLDLLHSSEQLVSLASRCCVYFGRMCFYFRRCRAKRREEARCGALDLALDLREGLVSSIEG